MKSSFEKGQRGKMGQKGQRSIKSIDYQREYGKDYYEGFLGSQNSEKNANFRFFLDLIFKEKTSINSVLDLGCGKGGFLDECKNRGIKNLYGVDVSDYALDVAGKIRGAKFSLINLERQKLPFPDSKFDLIVAIDVVEHVKNSQNIFDESYRVLKSGGTFFMTTENSGSIFSFLFSPFFKSHSGHINLNKESVWRRQLENSNFTNVKSKGIILHGFPPLLDLRNILRRFKIPVVAHPVTFPVMTLTGTLIISAQKY